jgi:O-antigen ligase
MMITAERTYDQLRLGVVLLLASLVIAVGVISIASLPALEDMIEKRANLVNSYDIRDGGRFDTQVQLIKNIFDNPIGHGPDRTIAIDHHAPHNVYVKVFSENGWLGGVAWLAFTTLTLIAGLKCCLVVSPLQKHLIIVYSVVLATAAESIIIDTLHWRHYFLMLGVLWGLIALQKTATATEAQIYTHPSGAYR